MPTVDEIFTEMTGDLDFPMFVVTAIAGGRRAGCLVGFVTQCSIDPPRLLVCLSDKNHTTRVAVRADALAVHFVPTTAFHVARLFGGETGDKLDKFARCHWHPGPEGLPILDDCERWFVGRIINHRKVGDHVVFVLAPIAASNDGSTTGLRFSQVKLLDPGHGA